MCFVSLAQSCHIPHGEAAELFESPCDSRLDTPEISERSVAPEELPIFIFIQRYLWLSGDFFNRPSRIAFRRRSALTSLTLCTTSKSLARPGIPCAFREGDPARHIVFQFGSDRRRPDSWPEDRSRGLHILLRHKMT